MKSMPPTPSSILPTRPSDIGRGSMQTPLEKPKKLNEVRAVRDWKSK